MLVERCRIRVWSEAGTQHNLQAAINSLPPETFFRIFELIQGDNSWPIAPPGFVFRRHFPALPPRRNQWIAVTAVCRRWRKIALGDPFLWNTLCIEKTADAQYYLEWIGRSACVPLNLLIHDYEYAQGLFAEKFSEWCPRLRRLEIRTLRKPDMLTLFKQRAPQLEILTILNDRHDITCLPAIFSDHTPRLNYVFLDHIIPPTPQLLSNLTHVTLKSPPWTSVRQVVDLLRANPTMQSLVLCSAYIRSVVDPLVEGAAKIGRAHV